jgi:hypothetical protein
LKEIAKEYGLHENNMVLAPTGIAAFNIDSSTIHSSLSVPICGTNFELEGESLKKLQNKLKHIQYFIIDEMSMVGRHFLAIIDLRLRQAFPDKFNIPFSGQSIILISDFRQLPPVCDLPIYSQDSRKSDHISEDGHSAYCQFEEIYKLEAVQR